MSGININQLANRTTGVKPQNPNRIIDFLNKDVTLMRPSLNDRKKESFYLELSILFSAGVDIKSALELIINEQSKLKDKRIFEDIKTKIIHGATLSEALKAAGLFTPYEYYSSQISEESGKLSTVLNSLASYYQKKIKQRRQIISALSYPIMVLMASVGAVLFMMNFVVPMFADIFKRFGGDLPMLTKVILQISGIVKNYLFLFLILLLFIMILLYKQQHKAWFRKTGASVILRMPLLGTIIRKIYLARFCHSMTLLIGAKIPLLKALSLVRHMVGFYPIEISLQAIETHILKGDTLHASLATFSIYPSRMVSLIKVGEEINQVAEFFDKIATQYAEDVEHQSAMISSLMEPFIIIFLGLVVGLILIAMYLPLFNLSNTI